ncbi:MAG: hypothetical protein D6678_04805 [Zetaproteobacteria bacterium]|nr:MAG: hypothetical protein D6678_04805 [Zetaproteobacteria bacterium]
MTTTYKAKGVGRLWIPQLFAMQLAFLVAASLMTWMGGYENVLAEIWYGGVLMMLNGLALAGSVHRALAGEKASDGRKLLYRGAAVRFVLLVALLAVAYRLGLYLPWVAGGMLVAQAAVYVHGVRACKRE